MSVKNHEIKKNRPLKELFKLFTIVSVMTLPFSKALTIDVGFPLKLYEISFFLATICLISMGKISIDKKFEGLIITATVFLTWVAISTAFSFVQEAPNASLQFRGGRIIDGLTRVGYLLFNILAALITYQAVRAFKEIIIRAWFVGLVISVSFHLLTAILFLIDGDAFLLPGLDRHQIGRIGGLVLPRSGTFEEGNFAGLYYLVSLAFAASMGRRKYVGIAAFGLALSQSTSAIIAFVFFALVGTRFLRRASIQNFAVLALTALILVFFVSQLDFADKLNGSPSSSGMVRLNQFLTGINIFLAHPLAGVGLGGYGFYFTEFEWDMTYGLSSVAEKIISNNVYIELLSETGIIGTLIFLNLLRIWYKNLSISPLDVQYFKALVISLLVGFLAYPTFNSTFVWVTIGITSGISSIARCSHLGDRYVRLQR